MCTNYKIALLYPVSAWRTAACAMVYSVHTDMQKPEAGSLTKKGVVRHPAHASVQHRTLTYTLIGLEREKLGGGGEFERRQINGTLRYALISVLACFTVCAHARARVCVCVCVCVCAHA